METHNTNIDNRNLSSKSLLDNQAIAASIFLTPALIFLGTFLIFPILYLLYLSFTTNSFTVTGIRWVAGRNYLRLLLSNDFWQVIFNTLYFTIATVIPSLIIPLGLAVGLNKTLAFRDFLRTAYFIPSITSIVAAGLGFRWLFQSDGFVNYLGKLIGLAPIPWLSSVTWAMPVLIVLSVWKQIGFNLVVFLAGLQTIPQSLYEAAELDGAGDRQQFWHITLPSLRPTLIFATVTTAIFTLKGFEQVYVVTGGGPMNSTNLLVYYIYQEAFAQFDFGYAAAAAVVLLLIALGLVYLQLKVWGED
jgi:multiple sugar transport system permease protein